MLSGVFILPPHSDTYFRPKTCKIFKLLPPSPTLEHVSMFATFSLSLDDPFFKLYITGLYFFGAGAEIRSDYEVESGIYMTSCAATILVAALISLGALMMAVLISLTVMLQSCQTKSSGALEMWNSVDDYRDCKIYALNAELNGLDARSVPSFCKDIAIKYIKQGEYMRDLETTSLLVENYLNDIKPLADFLDAVLMDIDDFVPLHSHYFSPSLPG